MGKSPTDHTRAQEVERMFPDAEASFKLGCIQDPYATWKSEINDRKSRGMTHRQAVITTDRKYPGLREMALRAASVGR